MIGDEYVCVINAVFADGAVENHIVFRGSEADCERVAQHGIQVETVEVPRGPEPEQMTLEVPAIRLPLRDGEPPVLATIAVTPASSL